MTYAATYNRICHLPDVRYDITSWVTTVRNALPAVAFPSRDRHTMVFTGPYLGTEGSDTRYTGVSGTKRSWLCYHRDIWVNCKHRTQIDYNSRYLRQTVNELKSQVVRNKLSFLIRQNNTKRGSNGTFLSVGSLN